MAQFNEQEEGGRLVVAYRCNRRDCDGFSFDDAEHMEDAIQKIKAHFRMDHPTKALWEQNVQEDVEQYNLSLDEQVARHTGIDAWREAGVQPRHIVSACQQLVRYHRNYPPHIIEGAIALAHEHGTEIPVPAEQPDAAERDLPGQMAAARAGIVLDEVMRPAFEIEDDEEPF